MNTYNKDTEEWDLKVFFLSTNSFSWLHIQAWRIRTVEHRESLHFLDYKQLLGCYYWNARMTELLHKWEAAKCCWTVEVSSSTTWYAFDECFTFPQFIEIIFQPFSPPTLKKLHLKKKKNQNTFYFKELKKKRAILVKGSISWKVPFCWKI